MESIIKATRPSRNTTLCFILGLIIVCNSWSAKTLYPSWQNSSAPHLDCVVRKQCTPTNKTYYLDSAHTHYNGGVACKYFAGKNIEHIYFIGDSYMRGISAAFYATLMGNHSLFTINSLRSSEDGKVEHMCHNKLVISTHLWELTPNTILNLRSLVFFSLGNHKIGRGLGPRYGVNNASIYREHIKPFCRGVYSKFNVSNLNNVFWISTHQRMISYFADETSSYVEEFNVKMREFVESGSCAQGMGYVDVFNMSKEVIERFPIEALPLSYDKVHYNIELNLIKVQIILNKLISSY